MREESKQCSVNLIKVWGWIIGRKLRKFRKWLADNRKRRRQNLHYKEPEVTESEMYDETAKMDS